MHNLNGDSSNYSETTGSLWFYSKDEGISFNANIANSDNFKPFKYKTQLLGNRETQADNPANGILKKRSNCVTLKYLTIFWRSLEIPLVNCQVEFKRRCAKH